MRRTTTTLALILTGMLAMIFLLSASLVTSRAQDVTPVPPLSWAEMQAMEYLSEEQITAIQKSCCLAHGQVWATETSYMPGGCIIDAFAPASQYWPIQNCETLGFREAVAPYLEATPVASDTPFAGDTPSPEISEGVQFTLRFESFGYESAEVTRATQDYDPSEINIWGFVLDQQGAPIPSATVRLVELDYETYTDEDGFYVLYVSTEGTRPYEENLDWTLVESVTGAGVSVELPDVLPLMSETPLILSVTDQNGQPLKDGNVSLSLVEPERPSFAALEQEQAWLDQNGQFSTRLFLGDPSDYPSACDAPLKVVLDVVVLDKDSVNVLAQARVERPLNLALVQGMTVGPDMQPRAEEFEPDLSPYAPGSPRTVELAQELFVAHERDEQGNFCVLVHPLRPGDLRQPPANVWQLKWGAFDHLPLYFPLPQAPQPGQELELGKIDVLTPQEHEQRLKALLDEFIREMPLTSSARGDALNGLNNVSFEYNSTGSVPYFQDNFTSFGGSIVTPHSNQEYWGLNLVNDEDAAYVIMLHELGHFLHHTLVERHNYLHVCYNKLATGSHETWQAPAGKGETGKLYLSFAESAGDFYAYVAYQYWAQKHPEIKESVYFKRREYLPEFENDDKAMAVLGAGVPGYQVEGVQTRFLQVYYGERAKTNPVWVYSDYLATMLLYMDVAGSWIRRPARTMQQWAQTKQTRDERVTALASRYQLLANPTPVLMPTSSSLSPSARVGAKNVDFSDFPVEEVPLGVEVEVLSGVMNLDLSSNTQRRNLYLGEGALIVLHSEQLVEVKKGLVGADFDITIQTPGAQVSPAGTMFVVQVSAGGETSVQTWQGQVRVAGHAGGSQTLSAGQQVAVSSGGALGQVSAFDVAAARQELLPAPNMPFDLPALGLSREPGQPAGSESETDLLGLGLIAALFCSVGLLFVLLLFARFRRRRKKRARKAAPRRAAPGRRQAAPAPQPAQGAVLVVLQGPSRGMHLPLGASAKIGSASDNDIVIPLPQVSPYHTLISVMDLGHVVADRNSISGTLVNGVRIAQPHLLRPGDVISVGGERFEYRV